ncbi:hypothetical protein [Actinomycetospora flava]|uniref:HEPN domain-containing protein n=1 Tax=Actinomycetospora flava TaxID=3129232 RepID=A0ABU8ME22_9PSEU
MNNEDEPPDFTDFGINWPGPNHDLLAVGDNPQTIFFFDWQRSRGYALNGRLMGYRKAADLLAQQVVDRGHTDELDTVFFAFASVWRHYMELQLKSLVVVHRLLLDKDRGKLRRHGLWPLWKELHALMEEAGEDVANESVTATARLLKQFDELDPTSQEFRYNERQDGSPTLESVSRLDYLSFHNGLDAVANLLEAVGDSVHQRLDFKRETQAEYEADMRELYEQDY